MAPALIEQAIANGELEVPEDVDTFLRRAEHMTDFRKSASGAADEWQLGDYLDLLNRGGFVILDIVDQPFTDDEINALGKPPKDRSMIIATPATDA